MLTVSLYVYALNTQLIMKHKTHEIRKINETPRRQVQEESLTKSLYYVCVHFSFIKMVAL